MLRRRIFSSAMASVMALSTVAVVAQAEETKAVKSEADLDKLVNETYGNDYRTGELLDYGTSQTEQMLDALDAAEAILYNDEAGEDDWTVAYYMVTGVKESLKKFTYEDLQKLIKKAEPKFAKNNIYNEELNDNIYSIPTYTALEDAYDNALDFTDTDPVPDITEAYIALETALNNLYELPPVTKSQYRAKLAEYQKIIADAHKYDSWRRGTGVSGDWTMRGGATFGYVYDTTLAAQAEIVAAYDELDQIKGLNITTDTNIREGYDLAVKAINFYKSWAPDADGRGSKASLKNLIDDYNGQLVYTFMSEVLGAADGSTSDSLIESIVDAGATVTPVDTGLWKLEFDWTKGHPTGLLVEAEAKATLSQTVYVPVDQNNKWITECAVSAAKPTKDKTLGWTTDGANTYANSANVVRFLQLSAGSKFDLADYIKIDPAVVAEAAQNTANGWSVLDNGAADGANIPDYSVAYGMMDYDDTAASTQVDLATAVIIADAYINGVYANIDDSDSDPKKVAQADAFAEYINGTDGFLDTIVATAADANGLTINLEGDGANIEAANDIIDVIDEAGVVATVAAEGVNGKAKGQTPELTLVYRYLSYALEDSFAGDVAKDGQEKTWKDVNKLVADAEQLVDDTGDAAIFNPSNVALVEAQIVAREWLARSDSDKLYRDGNAGIGADGEPYVKAQDAWDALYPVYDQLGKEYAALSMSFDDVYTKIYETAAAIDKGDLKDSADLQDAIKAVAMCLSNIDDNTYYDPAAPAAYIDNAAFDDSREFLPVNRVVTGESVVAAIDPALKINLDINPTHKALVNALTALDAAIEKATEPEVVVVAGDYDGDGDCDLDDASAMIAAEFAGGMDQTKGDFNGDGKTDLDDVSAIIAKEFEL